jgi:hypothetical protein
MKAKDNTRITVAEMRYEAYSDMHLDGSQKI